MAIEGCYLVHDIACQLWPIVPGRSKDYIQNPKKNGYRSLHSTHILRGNALTTQNNMPESMRDEARRRLVSYPMLQEIHDGSYVIDDPVKSEREGLSSLDSGDSEKETVFELQIRTKAMDREAEHGPSSHALYKSGM